LRKVVLTFSVYKKLKERLLIYSSFVILPLKDLINLSSAPLLGLLGASLSAGPPITSQVVLLRNILLQSTSKCFPSTLKFLGILLWCMVLVDILLEISLFNGFLTCKLRMMSSRCSWGILIFINLLKTEIKLGKFLGLFNLQQYY
jgi:ABC-type glucose/galactose transport system permease subunit